MGSISKSAFERVGWYNDDKHARYFGIDGQERVHRPISGGTVDLASNRDLGPFNILTASADIAEKSLIVAANGIFPGAIGSYSCEFGPCYFKEGSRHCSHLGHFLVALPNLAIRLMTLFDVIGDCLHVEAVSNSNPSSNKVKATLPCVDVDGNIIGRRTYYVGTVALDKSIAPVRMTDLYGECKSVIDGCIEETTDLPLDVKATMLEISPTVTAEICSRGLLLTLSQFKNMIWAELLGAASVVADHLNVRLDVNTATVSVDKSAHAIGSKFGPIGLFVIANIWAVLKASVDPAKYTTSEGLTVAKLEAILNPVLTSNISVLIIENDVIIAGRNGDAREILGDNVYSLDPTTYIITVKPSVSEFKDVVTDHSVSEGTGSRLDPSTLADSEEGVFVMPPLRIIELSDDLPACPGSCVDNCSLVLQELGSAGQFHKLAGFDESSSDQQPAPLSSKLTYANYAVNGKLSKDSYGIPKYDNTGILKMIDRHSSITKQYLANAIESIDPLEMASNGIEPIVLPDSGFEGPCFVILGYPVDTVISRSGYQVGAELFLKGVTDDLSGGITRNMGQATVLPANADEKEKFLQGKSLMPPPFMYYKAEGVNFKISSYPKYTKQEYEHALSTFMDLKSLQSPPITEDKNWWWLIVIAIALLMILVAIVIYQNRKSKRTQMTGVSPTNKQINQ